MLTGTRAARRLVGLATAGLLLATAVWLLARPLVFSLLMVTVTVRSGEITQTVPGWFLILGRERVYYSRFRGKVLHLVRDGQRVPAGALVCEIIDEPSRAAARLKTTRSGAFVKAEDYSQLVESPLPGVVWFEGDGFEHLRMVDAFGLPKAEVMKMRRSEWETHDGEVVSLGTPLFKVDEGYDLFVYVWLSPGTLDSSRLRTKEVGVRLPCLPESELEAVVADVSRKQLGTALSLHLSEYEPDLIHWRQGPGRLVVARYTGVIVPQRALTLRQNQIGVYVISTEDEVVFFPVRIVGRAGEMAAVSGLPSGSRVVVNPWCVLQ